MKDVCVIINPYAQGERNGVKANGYLQALEEKNLHCDVYTTNGKKHATSIVQEIIDDYDIFVAAGGDGLVHEMLQALIKHKNKQLAIIPAGTGNLLANHHNLYTIKDGVKSLKKGNIEHVDIIKLTYTTAEGKKKTTYSHCIFGIGYIATVLVHSNNVFRKFGPKLCYPFAAVSAALIPHSFAATISVNEKTHTFDDTTTFIFLNQDKVGPFSLAPDIKDTDGVLDYILYDLNSRVELNLCVLDAILHSQAFTRNKIRGKTKHVEIKLTQPQILMIDGEIYEPITHLEATIMPGALSLFSNKPNLEEETKHE